MDSDFYFLLDRINRINKIFPGFRMKPGKQYPPIGGNLYHACRVGMI